MVVCVLGSVTYDFALMGELAHWGFSKAFPPSSQLTNLSTEPMIHMVQVSIAS